MSTFFQALQRSLDERWPLDTQKNNQTFRDTKYRLKLFMSVAEDRPTAGLSLEDASEIVQKFLDFRRGRGVSGTTLENDRRALSSAFAYLIKRRTFEFRANPAFKGMIHQPKPVIVRCKRALNEEEVRQLLAVTRDTAIYPHILLCLAAGLRPIGASRIRPEHIDQVGRTICIVEKNRERIVPASAWLLKELADYQARGNKFRVLGRDAVTHLLADIRVQHVLPDHITMQALRRTFLKKLFVNNVSPQLAARLAGNSIRVIQKHYVEMETLSATGVVDCLDFSA